MSTSTPNPPSIVAFYTGYGADQQTPDHSSLTLNTILSFSNEQLEFQHDYIQILFPLPERSPYNPRAPTITREVREAFLARPELRNELRRSLRRMQAFYGFTSSTSTSSAPQERKRESTAGNALDTEAEARNGSPENSAEHEALQLVPAPDFPTQAPATWLMGFNHNHLRITRIIRSLRVLGLESEAREFYRALLENDTQGKVGGKSKMFWRRAVERGLWIAPEEEDEGGRGVEWLRED